MIRLQTSGGRKSRMLFTLLLFMSFSSCFGEQGYAVFDSSTGTLTFKYGTPTGTYYNTDNTGVSPGWYSKRESIKKVVFHSSFANARPTSCCDWFWCTNLTEINGIEYLNTSNVTEMTNMFRDCSSLTSLTFGEKFNTANVTSMTSMFDGCSSLTSLTFGENFNTAKVTYMSDMFGKCSGLTSLTFGENFNTANVKYMNGMFGGCSGLTSLTFGDNFNTANVTDMSGMFMDCSGLTSLDLSKFNTEKVTYMFDMFSRCSGLTSLTFGENFTTASCTSYMHMFSGCSRLRYLDFYASNDKFNSEDDTKSTKIFTEANLNRSESQGNALFGSEDYTRFIFKYPGLPLTTVIYMPHGISMGDYTNYTDLPNLVFNDGGTLKAAKYYSEDKVDIELPREFKTARAEYSRNMSYNYGSVVLPYAFKTDANIQAYTLDEEHTETMYFKNATTVAAHTPFAFKKLQSDNTANFVMTAQGFGITVEATRTTSAEEGGWPYPGSEKLGGWTTKGYYINETVANDHSTFYIAKDKFYKASDDLKLYPHRVTFHGAWTNSGTSGEAQFYNINTVSDSETITAIEAADLRHTRSVAAEVYDVAGRRLPEMVKGLNIVRMNDGSVRKVSIR